MKKNIFKLRNLLKILLSLLFVFILLLRLEIIGHPLLNMSFRYSDKKIINKFRNEDVKPEIRYGAYKNHTLRYLELITNPKLPYVVFIHGAPGSSVDYLNYFKDEAFYTQVNLISIDRLGYGFSEFGKSVTSIQTQAKAIQSVIDYSCKSKNIILVGHSYGGPIALKMAMDFPGKHKCIVLLAPALDPKNEKEIKIAQLALIQPIRWLTPPALRVAADEKATHIEELRKMTPFYDRINIPVCHIHGNKDSLVPFENLAFSKDHIDPVLLESITLQNADHFLPWSHYDFIVDKIVEYSNEH